MNRDIQLIIPMSGVGRRFIEAGYTEPKPLIVVDDKPIIEHVINMFPSINDITFICNEYHLSNTNMREILLSIVPNCKIYSVPNENRKGPVDAVYQIEQKIRDNAEVIVSYCDYGTVWDFDKFLEFVKDYDGAIPCYKGFHPHMLGGDNYAFCKETNNVLEQIKEKEPFTKDKMSEYASNGTYYFKSGSILKKYFKELINLDINLKGEYYVSLIYNLLVKDGLKVGIFEIEKMLQWGTPYDLEIYKGWSKYFKNIKTGQKIVSNPPETTMLMPMAGKGDRFKQQGYNKPKPLIEVDGLPMVIRAAQCLPSCNEHTFVVLDEHFKDIDNGMLLVNQFNRCNIIPINKVTQGQACTCEIALKKTKYDLNKPIMITACDNGAYYNADKYKSLVDDQSVDIIVWSFRNNQTSKINPNMYAWLDVDENDNICHVSCKKFIYDDPLKTHAIIGTMFFRKAQYFIDGLLENYKQNITTNGEFYVDDVLNQNIKAGLVVKVFEVENYICWGTPNDYKTYNYWKEYFESPLNIL